MIAFAALIAFLFGVGIAQTFFRWSWPTEFGVMNWIMSIALGIFCVLVVIGMCGHKFDWKKIGSYCLHFGFVFFLLGCLLFETTGEYVMTAVPVDDSKSFSSIEKEDGELLDLGFSFGIDRFEIEYYDPVYDVYKMTKSGLETIETDVQFDEQGYFDFGKYGRKHVNDLISGGEIASEITLDTKENVVALVRMTVKKYTAYLTLEDYTTNENGEVIATKTTTETLLVNETLRKNGFKIYLMSFNEASETVTLLFKKDIGEPFATSGLVLVMAGTLFHCLIYPIIKDRSFKKKLPLEKEGENK